MSKQISKEWLDSASKGLSQHLSSHLISGSPYINVLGPIEKEIELFDEIDDEGSAETEIKNYSNDAEWKYTPNKATYKVVIDPYDSSSFVTDASFYIRMDEGCETDKSLSIDDLNNSFKKINIVIESYKDFSNPKITLKEDGKALACKSEVNRFENGQIMSLKYETFSNYFFAFDSEFKLLRQKYDIRINKEVRKKDGIYEIKVTLGNYSPKNRMSSIPTEDKAISMRSENPNYSPKLKQIEGQPTIKGNRYGFLMEFELLENFASKRHPYDYKASSEYINVIMDTSNLKKETNSYNGKLIFRDFILFDEEVPKMTMGQDITQFFNSSHIHPELSNVFSQDYNYPSLFKFQEKAITEIQKAILENAENKAILISARTGGGKTEAFIIPIIDYCLSHQALGTKAIICYPTKALANSQASRIINILYYLNKKVSKKVKLGILHGDIPKTLAMDGESDDVRILPLECPECKGGRLEITSAEELTCPLCGCTTDFVKIQSRKDIYADPPDIVITNPDTLIWDVMARPNNHSIFGRPVYRCNTCNETYVTSKAKRSCEKCKGRVELIRPCVPKVIVFDEIHLCKGTFGINTSLFLTRLEAILNKYSKKYWNAPQNLLKIGSTATIANPTYFGKTFFNVPSTSLVSIPKNLEEHLSFYQHNNDESIKRHHLFIMPYYYSPNATIGRAIDYIQSQAHKDLKEYLKILTFVNSIKASNTLIALTKRTVGANNRDLVSKIGGHTTDFDKNQRAMIETDFNKDELNVLFATSTLEVGVDFNRIDCLLIDGFPFSFNDYLQRIGRAGRRSDSLIFTVAQNWKPVDHYFFVNAKELLNDPVSNSEPIPITRNNIAASIKHSLGCIFDYIMSEDNSDEYFKGMKAYADVSKYKDQIMSHIKNSIGIPQAYEEEILQELNFLLKELEDYSGGLIYDEQFMKYFVNVLNDKYQLTNLRSTDKQVDIEIRWSL